MAVEQGFFPVFPPLEPGCILWSGASYSLKNTATLDPDSAYVISWPYIHIFENVFFHVLKYVQLEIYLVWYSNPIPSIS